MPLPDFGVDAQKKLKDAKVLIVGAGGLGCPNLLYLAAAGIGHIGLIDDDTVDLSNLHYLSSSTYREQCARNN